MQTIRGRCTKTLAVNPHLYDIGLVSIVGTAVVRIGSGPRPRIVCRRWREMRVLVLSGLSQVKMEVSRNIIVR